MRLPISDLITIDQKKQFSSHMAKNHEEWQIKQADTALRFYNYFLSNHQRNLVSKYGDSLKWIEFEEKMHKALRLRQGSYNTEKTYLKWLQNFLNFAGAKPPSQLEGIDLQNFLSHLAVEKKIPPST